MLYEDQLVKVTLAENAAAHGHIIAQMQQNHLADLDEEQAAHLFLVASYCAAIMFQGLKAEGTNIVLEESPIKVHIIARKNNDNLNFQWEPKQAEPAALDDAQERISDKIGAPIEEQQPSESIAQEPVTEMSDEEEKENYLIKQLIRQP